MVKTLAAPVTESHGPLLIRKDIGALFVNILTVNQTIHWRAHSSLVSAKRAPDCTFVNNLIISTFCLIPLNLVVTPFHSPAPHEFTDGTSSAMSLMWGGGRGSTCVWCVEENGPLPLWEDIGSPCYGKTWSALDTERHLGPFRLIY